MAAQGRWDLLLSGDSTGKSSGEENPYGLSCIDQLLKKKNENTEGKARQLITPEGKVKPTTAAA